MPFATMDARSSPTRSDSIPTTPLADYVTVGDQWNRQDSRPLSPPPLLTPQSPRSAHDRNAWQLAVPRRWFEIRWQLTRAVFGRPLPFLTRSLNLKSGDLILTLPATAALIAINALAASNHDVGGSGSPAAIVMLVTFGLAVRNNFLLEIATGLSFERALFYHKFFGVVSWLVAGLHGLAYYLNWRNEAEEFDVVIIVSGLAMFGFLTVLIIFAFYKFRRWFFDLFLRFHWIFFLLIVIAGVIHGAAVILVGFLPWVADTVFRRLIRPRWLSDANNGVIHESCVTVTLVSKDIIRVQFPRVRDDTNASFTYEAGQYVYVCFPRIARFEWHPFTLASAPHEPMVTLFIKVSGDWTSKLANATKTTTTTTTMLVDGPYGATSIELDHYSHFVFVSGGIGITPMLSIANALYYESVVARTRSKPVQKAWFLWSVRDRETIEALMLNRFDQHDRPVQSWLPHALLAEDCSNLRESDPFVASYFLTKGTQDLSHPVDQQLLHCLQHGERPNLITTLREVGQLAARENPGPAPATGKVEKARVAVLVCGPRAMVSDVVVQSMRLGKELKNVVFDVHQETFDF